MPTKIKNNKLPKKFKNQWVKALRSGDYVQGHRTLAVKTGLNEADPTYAHCCIGVACRVVGIKNTTLLKKALPDSIKSKTVRRLPKMLREPENKLVRTLVHKNDTLRHSFRVIAAYIDRYF